VTKYDNAMIYTAVHCLQLSMCPVVTC